LSVKSCGLVLAVISLLAAGIIFVRDVGAAKATAPGLSPAGFALSLSIGDMPPQSSPRLALDAPTITPTATPSIKPSDTPTGALTGTPTGTPDPCAPAWIPSAFDNGTSSTEVKGIAALSPDDVWAVGYDDKYGTLVEHWDGRSWNVVPSPNVGSKSDNHLYGVAAVSARDVWAVGYYDTDTSAPAQTLIEHWDGRSWNVVPSPNVGSGNNSDNILKGVSAISDHDVWAVGYYYNVAAAEYRTLIEHWDGISWSVVRSPNVGASSNQLFGVSAASTGDVWAVGYYYAANYLPQTLIEHWDGISWSVVRSPNVGASSNQLYGVSTLATPRGAPADEAWAVGSFFDGNTWRTLVEHWDGSTWNVIPTPNVGANGNYLNAVAALSNGDIWAVGYTDPGTAGEGRVQTLVEHWNGSRWSVVPGANMAAGHNYLNGVAALSAYDVWAVGDYTDSNGYHALIEHYAPSCAPTNTPTNTPTDIPSPTATFTPAGTPGPAHISGHVTWQGPPSQPNARQVLPISMTLQLQSGGPATECAGLSTDPDGIFVATSDIAADSYNWRVKGPRYLAASGSVFVTKDVTTSLDVGLMKVGDANNDNRISVIDFNILKNAYGKSSGQPGYDDRADFSADHVLNSVDFTLLRTNFGLVGAPEIEPVTVTPSLLDSARLHDWRDLGSLHNAAFRESDITYDSATNKYYLFSTASYTGSGSVYMYVAGSPEDLVASAPITIAAGVYPSIVKDPSTGYWHLYAENFTNGVIRHFISTGTPSGPNSFVLQTVPLNFQVVDVQVRKHPTNGKWYAVGFPVGANQPLTILWANGPNGGPHGLWTVLGQVFEDTGPPPWAGYARPDPNLAFTPDGRAWVLFTGNVQSPVIHRPGIVEVDITTGKAIDTAVTLSAGAGYDPGPGWHNGTNLSDLNFLSVPGQPDRIFGFSNDGSGFGTLDMNWGVLDLEPVVVPSDGRTPADLARVDMAQGFDVASGIHPTLLGACTWGMAGLDATSGDGGAHSYLAAATLKDLTAAVEFTPSGINAGAIAEVANIGAHDYTATPGIDMQIAASGSIIAVVRGSDNTTTTLDSGIQAQVGVRYKVVLRRVGEDLALTVNGVLKSTGTHPGVLGGLEAWSLGSQARLAQPARYPFAGIIHSFVVTGSGQ
jgi:hypothetical protein